MSSSRDGSPELPVALVGGSASSPQVLEDLSPKYLSGGSLRATVVTLGIHHWSRCTHGVFGIQPLELWALKVKTPACAGAKALPPAPSLISEFRVQGKGRSGGRAVPFCWGNI